MICKCNKANEKEIIEYIGKDYSSCLYLYLNLMKYGFESDIIEVFLQHDEEKTTAVLLKYYSCLHVYSKNGDFCSKEVADFFIRRGFTILYCTAKTAESVYNAFSESERNKAVITIGWVAQIQAVDKKPKGLAEAAKEEDFCQIARLIYDDEDIGRSYQFNELVKQLSERNRQGYGRNLVIKNDGTVIAHACTNAESDNVAVVAELLVRKEYRRRGYASEIWRENCQQLLAEGKEVYSFYYTEESRNLHKHIGFFEVCEWTKIVI